MNNVEPQNEQDLPLMTPRFPLRQSTAKFPALDLGPSLSTVAKDIIRLGGPNLINLFLQTMTNIIGFYFVGLLEDVVLLDAVSLATTFVNIVGASVIYGFSTALDTLISQSFGKGNMRMCGIYLGRAVVVCSIIAIPMCLLIFLSGSIFGLIGIEQDVVDATSKYAAALVPFVIVTIAIETLERFLTSQQIVKPQMWAQITNTTLFPVFCYLFMFTFNWGYLGAAYAKALSCALYAGFLIGFVVTSAECKQSFVPPCREMLFGLREYFWLALPATAMVVTEWWNYEILNVFSGKLGKVALASNAIGMYFVSTIYLVCLGVGSGTATLVGNAVGEKDKAKAVIYTRVGVLMAPVCVAAISVFLLAFRRPLATMFTQDPEVTEEVLVILYLVVILEMIDGIQGTLSKTLVGLGKQSAAQWVTVVAFDCIMVPVGYLAAFKFGIGVYGLWMAYLSGATSAAIGFVALLMSEDWNKLIVEAHERMERERLEAEKSCV